MKIFMWITAIIFIVSFVGGLLVRNYFGGGQGANRFLATVNGSDVPMSRFRDTFSRLRDQRAESDRPALDEESLQSLRREAFTQVINQVLLQQLVEREGAEATSEEIRQLFLQQTVRDKSGRVNRRRAQQILSRMPEQRRKELAETHRRRIETFRMSNWLNAHVSLTDTEGRQLVREGLREHNLVGLYLDPEEYVDSGTVRTYYEQNRANYREPPRALVRHILLKPDTQPRPGGNALDSIKETIETVRRRFRAGDPVGELAREYSADTETAPDGGLLGWVTADDLDSSMANQVFGSNSDTGTLSNLVRTDAGYHLVYVEEGPVESFESLDEAEAEIRSTLVADTHRRQARSEMESLRRRVLESDDPLERLGELALLESHSNFASSRRGRYGWVPLRFVIQEIHPNAEQWSGEISRNNLVLDEISRTLSGLEPGSVSEVLEHNLGYHVLAVPERRDARLSTLSDTATGAVKNRLGTSKRNDYSSRWLEHRRRQASISLNVPEQRIGGTPDWL